MLKRLPSGPGIYFFLGPRKKTLYVGKAASLRDRVRSYFSPRVLATRGSRIVKMIEEAVSVDFRKAHSVLEAFLLEADFIKKLQPKYNVREKDDKSFNCIIITAEDFPRVLIARTREVDFEELTFGNVPLKAAFGPFPYASPLKEALRIIRKIFPWRDTACTPERGKPCFNHQLGLCPGVCTGKISAVAYAKTIKHLVLFLSGKKRELLRTLTREMKTAAAAEHFEEAAERKRELFALTHIQDVALIKGEGNVKSGRPFRLEAYDVAHTAGTDVVGVMTVVEDGLPKKSDYRMFRIRTAKRSDDVAALAEILCRRFAHREWPFPSLVVVDGNDMQRRAAEAVLCGVGLLKTPVVAVTKDRRHKPVRLVGREEVIVSRRDAILLSNSEAHRFALRYHRRLRSRLPRR